MISEEDPRFDPMLVALGACQSAYKTGNRDQFGKQADEVVRIAAFVPGAVIQWRGYDRQPQGPTTVHEVIYEDGQLWASVKWMGQLYWVSDSIIESIKADGQTPPWSAVRTF